MAKVDEKFVLDNYKNLLYNHNKNFSQRSVPSVTTLNTEYSFGSTAEISFISKGVKGDVNYFHSPNIACHAGLNTRQVQEPHAILSSIVNILREHTTYDKECYDNVQRAFIEYFVNRSPYKDLFMIRDVDEIISSRAFLVRTDVPINLLASCLISSRLITEYPYKACAFYDFIKHGMNEDMAFLTSWMYNSSSDSNVFYIVSGTIGHTPMTPSFFDRKSLRSFLTHTPINPSKELYIDCTKYNNVHTLYNSRPEEYGDSCTDKITYASYPIKENLGIYYYMLESYFSKYDGTRHVVVVNNNPFKNKQSGIGKYRLSSNLKKTPEVLDQLSKSANQVMEDVLNEK